MPLIDGENKKITVLKLLAIKAACFLKWNLSDLEQRYVCNVVMVIKIGTETAVF